MIGSGDDTRSLARRLERFRAAERAAARPGPVPDDDAPGRRLGTRELAERLAVTVGGEVVRSGLGTVVRCEPASRTLPIDRDRLARLPGHPPVGVPLVCLDTETTGLATATGTVAFLIGLGWWEADRFRQVQLLLPDHAEEAALLEALEACIPTDGWLVTYNGRGFDWPLLVTRYRMLRHPPPVHGGHLDLLPIVRRLFRHRLDDARLRTAEAGLLGLRRHGDVDGWEIPGRYLGFLRGGPAAPLADVVRHNDQDVRSLARLLAFLEQGYATADARRTAPAGDLAGLARAYARDGRLVDALGCYEAALEAAPMPATIPLEVRDAPGRRSTDADDAWWSPRVPADFGGRGPTRHDHGGPSRSEAFAAPWTTDRIAMERAHLLRRLGRWGEAAGAWAGLAAGPGRGAIVAAVELAKLREHRLRDPRGALDAASAGLRLADRRRFLGRPEPRLEADLLARSRRLRRRLLAARQAGPGSSVGAGSRTWPESSRTEPTCDSALGTTARRSRSRARRTMTAARSGTPLSPTPSTASEPAAAANRRS